MKYIGLLFAIACWLISCKEHTVKQMTPAVNTGSIVKKLAKRDFSGIQFASKKDLSCGMPLTAGLEDTTVYKGKYYGFCSSECKADFIKNAAVYTKQAGK